MRIEISDQVYRFVRELAPDPRRRVREGLRDLAHGKGDVKPLEGSLAGFHRLRVGRYRVLFHYRTIRGQVVLRCEYADERSMVYELFSLIARQLRP